jgi:hypothetical protein
MAHTRSNTLRLKLFKSNIPQNELTAKIFVREPIGCRVQKILSGFNGENLVFGKYLFDGETSPGIKTCFCSFQRTVVRFTKMESGNQISRI